MKHTNLLDKKLREKKILIAAHQGFAGGNIVLNSPNAMINAIKNGADIVEIDVAETSDKKYYAFHQDFEPRHLLIDEKIRDLSSQELDSLFLYNNSFCKTDFHVPKLSEMLNSLTNMDVLINLDKCDEFDGHLLEELDQYHLEENLIIKGKCDQKFLNIVNNHMNKYMFMPVIYTKQDFDVLSRYEDINIVGYEFIFEKLTDEHVSEEILSDIKGKGYFLWVNSLTLGKGHYLSADMDDDISILNNPDEGWGKLFKMGFNVIQTDWPNMLRDYINKKFPSKERKKRKG